MELNRFFLGIALALVVLALKVGAGAAAFLRQHPGRGARASFVAAVSGVYLTLFVASFAILQRDDLVRYLDPLQRLVGSGLLSFLLAVGFLLWGSLLLWARDGAWRPHWRWLLLVSPCPISVAAIVLANAVLVPFTVSFRPDAGFSAAILLYGLLVVVGAGTPTVWPRLFRGAELASGSLMGGLMLAVAGYFLFAAAPLPGVGETNDAGRAAGPRDPAHASTLPQAVALGTVSAGVFLAGFVLKWRNLRRPAR